MTTEQLDILIFGAHPDDAEIGMGGTILKHTKKGWKVGICDLTLAEMSSNGNPESRQHEAAEAGHILGLCSRSNLRLPDRGLRLDKEHIDAIVEEIRKCRPAIVLAPYWEDRHPDHVMCSRMVQEAVFNAKLRRYMPHLPAWSVTEFYFYFINDMGIPDFIVDITAEQDGKMQALAAYRSQFEAPEGDADRVRTPLTQAYLERVEARDQLLGQQRMFAYAEGFVSRLPLAVDLFRREIDIE